jgi:aryl-alcohol dehydrogenase-like predicted oxidoreductase
MTDDGSLHVLGDTGARLSRIGLGALMLGPYGNNDRHECRRIIHKALDTGINVIDTADGYSEGESEVIVGDAIADRRERVFLATKVGMRVPGLGPEAGGTSRRWIVQAVEASLRRLRTDHIDLYQLHSYDPATPIDETLDALTQLVADGKVLFVGSSNFAVDRLIEAQWAAERSGHVRLVSEQLQYSLLDRRAERGALPVCLRYGIGVLAWSPLHGGWLTDRAAAMGRPTTSSARVQRVPRHYDPSALGNREKRAVVDQLAALAAELGITLVQLALAFCTSHAAVTTALVGAATLDEVDDALPALTTELDDGVLDRLDELVAPGAMVGFDYQTPSDWQAVPRLRRTDFAS